MRALVLVIADKLFGVARMGVIDLSCTAMPSFLTLASVFLIGFI